MTLALLDLGYGNVESVRLGFARLGAEPQMVRDKANVMAADRLVLPGVGNAGYAMDRLAAFGLVDALRQRTKPLLGICVGMQLFFEGSEESERPLLGRLAGRVRRLDAAPGRPVPHMGWSRLADVEPGLGLADGDQLYFAHSFACDDGPATAARTDYGRPVPAAVRQGNLWGAQFHPERSSQAGARYLEAFLAS